MMLNLQVRDGSSTVLRDSSRFNDSRRRKDVAWACRQRVEEAVNGLKVRWMYLVLVH